MPTQATGRNLQTQRYNNDSIYTIGEAKDSSLDVGYKAQHSSSQSGGQNSKSDSVERAHVLN